MISNYSREAGLRDLRRMMQARRITSREADLQAVQGVPEVTRQPEWIFLYPLDGVYSTIEEQFASRVNGDKKRPCYLENEFTNYELSYYYRYALVGLLLGSNFYFLTFIFLILSESGVTNLFDIFHRIIPDDILDLVDHEYYLYMLLGCFLVVFIARFLVVFYLRAYLLFLINMLILFFTIAGSRRFSCRNSYQAPELLGSGTLPLAFMSYLHLYVGEPNNLLISEVWESRCDQSMRRMQSVNILAELFCFIISTRLLFV